MKWHSTRLVSVLAAILLVAIVGWLWHSATDQDLGFEMEGDLTAPIQEAGGNEGLPPAAASVGRAPAQNLGAVAVEADGVLDAPFTGSISGVILLDGHQAVDTFDWVVRMEGPGMQWPMNKLPLKRSGGFASKQVPPGVYRLLAEHKSMPIASVDEIEVVANQVNQDPRINPWRVEQAVREMRIRIAGQPGNSGATNVWAVDAENRIKGHASWEGADRILRCAGTAAPDVVIIAKGFLPQRLAWQDGPVDVRLDPGIEVELQAVTAVELADGIRRGWFVLRPETSILNVPGMQFDVGFFAQDLIDGKPVKLRLPGAASYELRFDGDTQDGPGFAPLYQKVIQRGLIVTDRADLQRLLISLPNPLTAPDPNQSLQGD
jgi:hypothetical protein